MREIKFRGKSDRTGKFIYGDLLTSPNGLEKFIVQKVSENEYYLKNLNPEPVEPETVGQYTGRKDKNGKEIYEGDIGKIDNKIFQVVWENACFWIKRQEGNLYQGIPSMFIVIGNIYENPELLEVKNES